MKILDHLLIKFLKDADLEKHELPWELVDLVEAEIEKADVAYLGGIEDYKSVKAIWEICSPRFTECNSLSRRYPDQPIIKHNMEIFLLVTMNLSLSLMSRPSKSA